MENLQPLVHRLSLQEISEAWEYLAHLPSQGERQPPPHLKDLSLVEWHLLHLLLQRELAEKGSSPVH